LTDLTQTSAEMERWSKAVEELMESRLGLLKILRAVVVERDRLRDELSRQGTADWQPMDTAPRDGK